MYYCHIFPTKAFFFLFFYSHQVLRPPATFLLAADGIYLTCSINIICGERPFISFSASAGGLQTFPRWISPASTPKRLQKKKKHVEGPYVASLDLPDPLLHPPRPSPLRSHRSPTCFKPLQINHRAPPQILAEFIDQCARTPSAPARRHKRLTLGLLTRLRRVSFDEGGEKII